MSRRIEKETQRLHADPEPGITVNVDPNNKRYFKAVIDGPAGTCYEGGMYTYSWRVELSLCQYQTFCYSRNARRRKTWL